MDEYQKMVAGMDQDALAKAYKNIFETPNGKIVLTDLQRTFFKSTSTAYVEDETGRLVHVSSEVMQRNEGMRITLLHIENKLNYQPEAEPQESEQVQ